MPRAALSISFQQPFLDAVRAAEARRAVLPNEYYGKVPDAAHSVAWTMSGGAGLAQILEALRSLNEANKAGKTFAEWQADAGAKSWGLPPGRLETIFRTHAQTAYSAGHWRQFQDNAETRGYLMYSAINDNRTRPAHRAMSGYIAPVDDPIWKKWTPPCGYNCRCSQISLTAEQARARGVETQDKPSFEPDPGFGARPDDAEHAAQDYFARAAAQAGPALSDGLRQLLDRAPPDLDASTRQAFGGEYGPLQQAVLDVVGGDASALPAALGDLVALRGYTSQWYTAMNAALREGSLDTHLMDTVAAAWRALFALPEETGTLYRGIRTDGFSSQQLLERFLEAHKPGEIVQWSSFTSGSFSKADAWPGDVVFEIVDARGVRVSEWSRFGHENEVILKPAAKFKVLKVTSTGGRTVVQMQQLADDAGVPPGNVFAASSDAELDDLVARWNATTTPRVPHEMQARAEAELLVTLHAKPGYEPMAAVRARCPQIEVSEASRGRIQA